MFRQYGARSVVSTVDGGVGRFSGTARVSGAERSAAKLIELTHMRVLLEGEGTVLSIRKGGVPWEARLTAAHHQLSHIEKRIHAQDDPQDLWIFGSVLKMIFTKR